MTYETRTTDKMLFCPLTRKSCMGRLCACAVRNTDYHYDPNTDSESWSSRWYCGLPSNGEAGVQQHVDEEPNDIRRD